MTDKKNLEQTIELAFENGIEVLPEDKYFKNIWNAIETRAPVGEKYYLRAFFSVFFFLLFFILFILFYTEFLSSILTLKNIRQENASLFSSIVTPELHPLFARGGKEYKQVKMAGGIILNSLEKTLLLVKSENRDKVEWDFFSGHVVIEKTDAQANLVIHLPDMTFFLRQGRCNLFCYDRIIRIIPLAHPVMVEINGEKQSINPGKTFYMLNKQAVIY